MAENLTNIGEKPYEMCLNCAFLGNKCDGPNFISMTNEQRVKWCKLRKDALYKADPKWTNQYISDITGISKATVDRFFRGEIEDIRLSTLSTVLRVLVNGDDSGEWKQYPCAMGSFTSEVEEGLRKYCNKLEADNSFLQAAIENKNDKINFIVDQLKRKDKQIEDTDVYMEERANYLRRKDRFIAVLSVLFVCSVVAMVWLAIL